MLNRKKCTCSRHVRAGAYCADSIRRIRRMRIRRRHSCESRQYARAARVDWCRMNHMMTNHKTYTCLP